MPAALLGLLLATTAARVELRAADPTLTDALPLRVELRSLDGQPHEVRLEGSSPGGLRLDPGDPVRVPAGAAITVERLLFRGAAPWDSRQELRLVALEGAEGGETPEPAGFVSLDARVRADPAWLPRLRRPLALLGLGLLLVALLAEARRALRERR